jgi:hypothetical protein
MNNNESIIPVEKLMEEFKIFWQYPVITEKEFYLQNKEDPNCLVIPWATLIDSPFVEGVSFNNISNIVNNIKKYCNKNMNYYTCCQHIYYERIITICKFLGINTIYSPHKVKGCDYVNGIKVLPCPLYAINYEDESRNETFKNIDFLTIQRDYLYSFIGGYQNIYLSNVRLNIFKINSNSNQIYIKNSGTWHFNDIVYNKNQSVTMKENIDDNHKKKTDEYNSVLLNSRFSLSPSGSGPNSIRFWESLAVGSIPILLSDTLELPYHPEWNQAIIFLEESKLNSLDSILNDIDMNKENQMRKKCIEIYHHFRKNYRNL